jgi:hypothetical protein
MLKFQYKLRLDERVRAKCPRHPRYNPEEGRNIKGVCSTCFNVYDLYQARLAMDAAVREFVRRAGPWAVAREPRRKKSAGPEPQEPAAPPPEGV